MKPLSSTLGDQLKKLIAISAAALLLTACSTPAASQPEPAAVTPTATATPTPVVMGPGEFTFTHETGAKGTMQIPGTADVEIEKLRAIAGAAPTTYLTVNVDNRAGTANVNMYGVSIFTPEGKELKYTAADTYIDSLRPDGGPAEVYNQFIDASNQHGATAKPKAVKDFVMVGPKVPAEITAVTVYPTGVSNPVDATPAT